MFSRGPFYGSLFKPCRHLGLLTIPFIQSRASWPLIVTTVVIMMIGASLPFSPLGPTLGFTPLPLLYWPLLAAILLGDVVLTQLVKTWLLRKGWVAA